MDRQGQHGHGYRRDPYGDGYNGPQHASKNLPRSDPSYGPASGPRGPGRPRDFERASYTGSSSGLYNGGGGGGGVNGFGSGGEEGSQGRRLSYTRRLPEDASYPLHGSTSRRMSSPGPDQPSAADTWTSQPERRFSRDATRPGGYPPYGAAAPTSPKWRGNYDTWSDAVEPPRKRLNLGPATSRQTDYAGPWSAQRSAYDRRPGVESEEEGEMESDHGSYRSGAAVREREPTFGERLPRNGRMSLLPRDDGPRHKPPRGDFDANHPRHRTDSATRFASDAHSPRPFGVRRLAGAFQPPTSDTGWTARPHVTDAGRSISRSPRLNGQAVMDDASPSAPRRSSNDSDASFARDSRGPIRSMSRTPPLPPPHEPGTPPSPRSPTPKSPIASDRQTASARRLSATPPIGHAAVLSPAHPTTLKERTPSLSPAQSPAPEGHSTTTETGQSLPAVKQEVEAPPLDLALTMEERARRMGLLPPSPVRHADKEADSTPGDLSGPPDDAMVTEQEGDENAAPPTKPISAAASDHSEGPDRSPSPTTATPAPALDFDGCLGQIFGSYCEDFETDVVRLSSARTRPLRSRTLRPRAPLPSIKPELDNFELLGPFICDLFKRYDDLIAETSADLKDLYREHQTDWQEHCDALDGLRSRLKRKPAATPITPSIDPLSGLPFSDMAATPGPSSGRSTRRTAMNTFGLGDAVRSEAEFQEILASLENADLRDPNMRAMRTTAVVPDMALTAEEQRLLVFDDDNSRIVDPFRFFELDDAGPIWTEDEEETFRRRYSQYPKQFGKIASKLPEKTRADCVTYYYRTKHMFDYRGLLDRRGREGRRKKGRRFAGRDAKATGKSLLANIKPALDDEDDGDEDEEEDSLAGSPATTTMGLPRDPTTPGTLSRPKSSEALSRTGPRNGIAGVPVPPKSDLTVNGDFPSVLRTPSTSGDAQAFLTAMSSLNAPQRSVPAAGDLRLQTMTTNLAMSDVSDKTKVRRKPKSGTPTESAGDKAGGDGAPKRRLATSSYWTKDEKAQFMHALRTYGKDWKAIAAVIANKTATQCKNFFQNHAKKLGLADIAEGQMSRTEGDDPRIAPATHRDYTVPLGVPLQQSIQTASPTGQRSPPLAPPTFPASFTDAGRRVPQAGFFSSAPQHSSGVLSTPAVSEQPRQSSMNLRNLLNDDAASSAPAYMDAKAWFGGDADDDASTEDEAEARPPAPIHPGAAPPMAPRTGVDRPLSAPEQPQAVAPAASNSSVTAHAWLGQPGRYVPDLVSRPGSLVYTPPVSSHAHSPPLRPPGPPAPSSRTYPGYVAPPTAASSDSPDIESDQRPKLPSLSGGLLGGGFSNLAAPMHPMQRSTSMDHRLQARPPSHPIVDYPTGGDGASYLPPLRVEPAQSQPYLPCPPRRVASDSDKPSQEGYSREPGPASWEPFPSQPASAAGVEPSSAPLQRTASFPPRQPRDGGSPASAPLQPGSFSAQLHR